MSIDKWLESIKLDRDSVYICNINKCRPPNNRNPTDEEVAQCLPYLQEQINIIQPKAMMLLGSVALKSLFDDKKASIKRERGNWKEFNGIPLMPTYHPAFLLRQMSEENKNKVKHDLELVQNFLKGNDS